MPLNKFLTEINEEITGLVKGMQVYGLAQSVTRTKGSDTVPAINNKGEYKYIGVDDINPVIIYHKAQGLTTARLVTQGYGDSQSDYLNTYQMAMIVYLDTVRAKMEADELYLYLQARIPGELNKGVYRSVRVSTRNVILNAAQVWQQEYGGLPFALPVEKTLFQINYTIESRMNPNCFEKCPEDCS